MKSIYPPVSSFRNGYNNTTNFLKVVVRSKWDKPYLAYQMAHNKHLINISYMIFCPMSFL